MCTYRCHQALKALALVRSQKVEESLVLCDEVLAARPADDSVLSAMMHVLRGLGRRMYLLQIQLRCMLKPDMH